MKRDYIIFIIIFMLAFGIFLSGYLFESIKNKSEVECKDCVSLDCMNYDKVCGDFGTYHFSFLALVIFPVFAIMIIVVLAHSLFRNTPPIV